MNKQKPKFDINDPVWLKFMLENYGQGFDWLEKNSGVSQETWKELWNSHGLGIKRFPATLLSEYVKPLKDKDTGLVGKRSGRVEYAFKSEWPWFDRQGRKRVRRIKKVTDLASVPSSIVMRMIGMSQDTPHLINPSQPHDEGCETHEYLKPQLDWYFYQDILLFRPRNSFKMPNGDVIALDPKPFWKLALFQIQAFAAFLAVFFFNFSYFKTPKHEAEKEFLLSHIAYLKLFKVRGEINTQIKIAENQLAMLQSKHENNFDNN